ncbi:MAG: hypothetical protein RL678_353 [Pseudomonadota bacterium]|jgi:hypothetical protein
MNIHSKLGPLLPPKCPATNWRRSRALVVSPFVKWGELIQEDARREFDLIFYSYEELPLTHYQRTKIEPDGFLSFRSEFFGESIVKIYRELYSKYEVIMIVNSDVYCEVSTINTMFNLGDLYGLDFFQPAHSPNGYISHPHLVRQNILDVREVSHIEIVAFALSKKAIEHVLELGIYSISGWGMDNILFPYIQQKYGLKKSAVIDCCTIFHLKENESGSMRFSNSLTAAEEMELIAGIVEKLRLNDIPAILLE